MLKPSLYQLVKLTLVCHPADLPGQEELVVRRLRACRQTRGGHTAIQSLLATAKLNGLEPLAWLTDTLEKLPTWPNSRIDELLPLAPATTT